MLLQHHTLLRSLQIGGALERGEPRFASQSLCSLGGVAPDDCIEKNTAMGNPPLAILGLSRAARASRDAPHLLTKDTLVFLFGLPNEPCGCRGSGALALLDGQPAERQAQMTKTPCCYCLSNLLTTFARCFFNVFCCWQESCALTNFQYGEQVLCNFAK